MANLTAPMKRALQVINTAQDKVIPLSTFFRAMGVTTKGRYLIKHRMESRRLIAMSGDRNDLVTITFAGMQALES